MRHNKHPLTEDNMHILQPKHIKLNEKQVEELLKQINISKSQLPKILSSDSALPEGCEVGDIIRIERKDGDTGELNLYYRVVIQ
jgi:DNA-directed RNA polymerase subunit H